MGLMAFTHSALDSLEGLGSAVDQLHPLADRLGDAALVNLATICHALRDGALSRCRAPLCTSVPGEGGVGGDRGAKA